MQQRPQTVYQYFIGIDISKSNFVVAQYGQKTIQTFTNNPEGFEAFCNDYQSNLSKSLVVIETTGGHEMAFIYCLMAKKVVIHRANARKVKYLLISIAF